MSFHLPLFNWILLIAMTLFLLRVGYGYYKDPSPLRLDIALCGLPIAGLWLYAANIDQLGWLAQILQFSHQVVLLRLAAHFRPVPKPAQLLALLSSGSAVILFTAQAGLLPTGWLPLFWSTLLTLLPWAVYVGALVADAWATWAFASAALRTRGVSSFRLFFAALGLALVIVGILPGLIFGATPIADTINQIAITVAAFCFYAGFVTPPWLLRILRTRELHQFLDAGSDRTMEERAARTLDRLGPAAMRGAGGVAAAVALWDYRTQGLVLHPARTGPVIEGPVYPDGAALEQAWTWRRPVYALTPADLGPEGMRLVTMAGARGLMVAPIATEERTFGLLLLFLHYGSLFPADDLDLLDLMAEQSAIALANAALLQEERWLAEQLTRTNRDLEQASRTKSEFLASMSHELRTPLNAIIGFSEVLLDDSLPVEEPMQEQFLENILGSGRHLLALINDILDLSKVEAGKMELHPEETLLTEALQACEGGIRPLAEKKRHTITFQVEPDLPEVYHDPIRLRQVVHNLLTNACKFTPDGGQITVRAYRPDETCFEIAVTDTGIGIGPEHLETIFEEFKQVDSGYARKQQGTGLGLALVRRFARLMGGEILVTSQADVGSTFTLHMPLRQPDLTPAITAGHGPLVLVVEDDAAAASLLALHLTRGGYQIERAANAVQAVEMARHLRPVAITLDIVLPREDGWHVLHQLKQDPLTQGIPVIVVSMVNDPVKAREAGAAAHLTKPAEARELLAALERVLAPGPAASA